MKPEEQRIKIAEACGWGGFETLGDSVMGVPPQNEITERLLGPRKITNWTPRFELPDYLNDLNAMHGAAKCMNAFQWEMYREELAEICTPLSQCRDKEQQFKFAMEATAAQRAEAFLKTLNLWTP